jgi:hypothetical protein
VKEATHEEEQRFMQRFLRAWVRGLPPKNENTPSLRKPGQIRVMQVLTRLGAGGPPLHVLCLNHEMGRYGYEMLLMTGRCTNGERDMTYLLQDETHLRYIPEMQREISFRSDLVALWRLYRAMRQFRPEIVHTHTAKAGALGRIAARLAGVPACVHTFHRHLLNKYL